MAVTLSRARAAQSADASGRAAPSFLELRERTGSSCPPCPLYVKREQSISGLSPPKMADLPPASSPILALPLCHRLPPRVQRGTTDTSEKHFNMKFTLMRPAGVSLCS
ncbi:hypothetical protein EVAR_58012_1 [Eumeta japonica]|uniref:Uncharacterized protein n=1 Tax=Eumeta variegata TaxID=151549 RepID=A0A4C1Y8H5_EUMVA|nr:hypothetical protein EVAR_58012_1 [Eumeta japonica]